MGRTSTLFVLSFCLMICSSCEVLVATCTGNRPKIERIAASDSAQVTGVLGKRFYRKLLKFSEENPTVKNLVLHDIPGSMNDEWNVKSCLFLHQNCFNTLLTDSSMIASGGVDLFISGNKRTVSPLAQIGVHSWSDLRKDGSEYPRDSEEHQLFLDFFDTIEMDTSFYWYTLRAAPANSIYWMNAEDIDTYGLRNELDSTHVCF